MPGMPDILERFARRFPEDVERRQILELRWPVEFTCPECMSRQLPMVTGRRLLKCRACRRPVRITTGTLFEGSRVSLPMWFKVIGEMTRHDDPVSASQLSRELGLRRQTVQDMLKKLRRLIWQHGQAQLAGIVQVDELLLASAAGQPVQETGGHGAMLIAVERRGSNELGHVALRALIDFQPISLVLMVQSTVKKGNVVETDSLDQYRVLKEAGYEHRVVRARAAAGTDLLPDCKVVAEKVMRWLGGVYGSSMSRRNLDLYLVELAFRLNHTGPMAGAQRFMHLLRLAVGHTGADSPFDSCV